MSIGAEQTEAPGSELPLRRDVRCDRIGFAQELLRQYVEPLKAKLKGALGPGQRCEADYFSGQLVAGETTSVDAGRWLKLFEAGDISRKEYLEALSVSARVAGEVLERKVFERITTTAPATPRLTIVRKKGVEVGLVQALEGLGAAIADRGGT